jgi:predicted metalloprotease with PDZ domain
MQLESFLRIQTLWDETMAESVARYLTSPAGKDKHLLVVAGGNHVSSGFGIPRRAFRRFPVSYLSIGGEEISGLADKQDRMMNVNLPEFPMVPYDFLAYLGYESLPQTGVHLGVVIEPASSGSGLVVMNVSPGSNAERSGIRQGDLLLAIDGEALADNIHLVYTLKRKHPGDHVVLQVKRDGKTVKVDVILQASGKEQVLDKR